MSHSFTRLALCRFHHPGLFIQALLARPLQVLAGTHVLSAMFIEISESEMRATPARTRVCVARVAW